MAFNESGGHWYYKDGRPCHSVPMTTKAGTRPVRVSDAMKLGLFPSVTTVLKTQDKPALTDWKVMQAALFAPKVPRLPDEDDRTWVKRVKEVAFSQVDEAAEKGKNIHKALELHFGGETYAEEWKVYVEAVDRWMAAHGINVLAREVNLVHLQLGYAGMTDLVVGTSLGTGIGDYKTRKSIPDKDGKHYPMSPYDDQPTQVAAYHMAQFGEIADNASGFNLFISTVEPGRVEGTFYDAKQLRKEWRVFEHILAIWQERNEYFPQHQAT